MVGFLYPDGAVIHLLRRGSPLDGHESPSRLHRAALLAALVTGIRVAVAIAEDTAEEVELRYPVYHFGVHSGLAFLGMVVLAEPVAVGKGLVQMGNLRRLEDIGHGRLLSFSLKPPPGFADKGRLPSDYGFPLVEEGADVRLYLFLGPEFLPECIPQVGSPLAGVLGTSGGNVPELGQHDGFLAYLPERAQEHLEKPDVGEPVLEATEVEVEGHIVEVIGIFLHEVGILPHSLFRACDVVADRDPSLAADLVHGLHLDILVLSYLLKGEGALPFLHGEFVGNLETVDKFVPRGKVIRIIGAESIHHPEEPVAESVCAATEHLQFPDDIEHVVGIGSDSHDLQAVFAVEPASLLEAFVPPGLHQPPVGSRDRIAVCIHFIGRVPGKVDPDPADIRPFQEGHVVGIVIRMTHAEGHTAHEFLELIHGRVAFLLEK